MGKNLITVKRRWLLRKEADYCKKKLITDKNTIKEADYWWKILGEKEADYWSKEADYENKKLITK